MSTATFVTNQGSFTVQLMPEHAPVTVENFIGLASGGKEWTDPRDGQTKTEALYPGTVFHRVIDGFMIQGGDPTGTGSGGPGYELKAEFNDTKHTRGVLSMARTQDPDSAGSQFFIMHGNAPFLDNKYTAFGKVTEGLETVDKIVNAPTGANDRPNQPTKINKITIEEKAGDAKEAPKQ